MKNQMKPGDLITLDQVQAIQGSQRVLRQTPKGWKRFRRVRAGTDVSIKYGPTSMRVGTTDTLGLCGPANVVIACPPVPRIVPDRERVEEVAAGVADGLRRAPFVPTVGAPWQQPGYRAIRWPQTARVVLSTFGATNVRTVMAQKAMAGYLGTTNAAIATAVPVAATPVSVINFKVTDWAYRADELIVACPSMQKLYLAQWTVSINGRVVLGPSFLVGGRIKLNVNANRDDTISVNIIMITGDSFVLPAVILVDGWTYPATQKIDGTYDKVLRGSPNWSTEEGVAS